MTGVALGTNSVVNIQNQIYFRCAYQETEMKLSGLMLRKLTILIDVFRVLGS